MKNYQYDEENVKALVEWAKATKFPREIRLTEAEHICDVARFVQANIYDIEEHYPDSFYYPSITRLYRLKEFLEAKS